MARSTAEFAFSIGDQVKLKAIGMLGIVDSMYRVVYWTDGERRSEWLYDWEIEA